MERKFATGLVITSFNEPESLDAVLSSVLLQTVLPNEVIVCDDGSSVRIRGVCNKYQNQLSIKMCWQRDTAFRAARVRNLGALKAEAEHLIFIDGDCLLSRQFVERHRKFIERGLLVTGGRVLVSEKDSAVAKSSRGIGTLKAFSSWKHLYLPLGPIRLLMSQSWQHVRTCNMSVWADDLLTIGGFDESYIGWGLEDSDFVIRMHRSGVRNISGRLAVAVAHLQHERESESGKSVNEDRFSNLIRNRYVSAKKSCLLELGCD